MAGLTFLDLMLADALAGGLAREQARREKPPPDNVFVLPKNLSAWNQIKDACKKENMVFLVDITDGSREICRKVDNLFFDLAREFDSLPFFVMKIGPFETFDQVYSYAYACTYQSLHILSPHNSKVDYVCLYVAKVLIT